MFQVGDMVCYGTTGACQITSHEARRYGDRMENCFVLKPVFDKSMTICVPESNEQLVARMHPVMTKEELMKLIRELPEEDARCDPNPDIYYDADGQKQIAEISDDSVHMEQSFTLLEESGCPAVLAEQCFVTSPADVAAFGDEEGCHTAAEIYYNAICQWYEANAAGGDVDGNAGSDAPV